MVGLWREKQDGENFRGDRRPAIDAMGKLPNGSEFTNFDQFRQLLFEQDDRFRRALAERLLVYTLGRPIEPSDDAILMTTVEEMKRHDNSLRTLIRSIVSQNIFVTK